MQSQIDFTPTLDDLAKAGLVADVSEADASRMGAFRETAVDLADALDAVADDADEAREARHD